MNGISDETGDPLRPLKVIVVGAGIGGLSAAIALRDAGHIVQIYESSRFAIETGAAINLPSNANGLLRRFGIKAEDHGGVICEWISEYGPSGERPWQLIHRIDLHDSLKEAAVKAGVEIFLQSRVVKADIEKPEITLADGKTVSADLILGADGTHSTLRKLITGPDSVSRPSGTSAFRFLIPVDAVRADPKTVHFAERDGELRLLYGLSRRIFIYPCRKNTELNFVCLHPDEESEGNASDWNQSASKELVLRVFDEYPEDVRALLAKVEPDTIKLWKLFDLPALSTWTKGRLALLGDAAHPFLPHQGQGGAQAIEDGVTLGALFPLGTLPSEIEERLKLYMEARYEHATTIQQYTRDAAFKTERGNHGGKAMNPMQFVNYNLGHDAYDHAAGILKRHLTSKATYRRMPSSFGPCAGPRQGFDGKGRAGIDGNVRYRTSFVTLKTGKSYLSTLLPSPNFTITTVSGWTTATFSITKLENLKWLGGRGYSHFGLYIHNIVYKSQVNEPFAKYEKETKVGDFLPVLFENMADPIITRCEELGFSKVFATLDETHSDGSYDMRAGWEGTEFCHIRLTDLKSDEAVVAIPDPPIYHQKVLPSSSELSKLDVDCITVSQVNLVEGAKEKRWAAGGAEIKFTELTGRELEVAFPTLANIIDGLTKIRVEEIIAVVFGPIRRVYCILFSISH